ncbi:hypothetical protein [Micromonospora sp. NPDC047730]|uniref:hypothetical protein n=1 Tax=Micromonospora sp. NPDC047730 TaxID=3364253 RepID=UPI003719D04F
MTQIGARVLAVRNTTDDTVYAYGYGVYVGDHPRPGWTIDDEDRAMAERSIRRHDATPAWDPAAHFNQKAADGEMTQAEADQYTAEAIQRRAEERARPMAERIDSLLHSLSLNPKIVLDDDAGVVWGMECWWGAADDQRWARVLESRQLVTVPAPHPPERQPLPAAQAKAQEV